MKNTLNFVSVRLRVLLLVILSTVCVAGANAQKKNNHRGGDIHKEIRDFRIKFVAQEIELRDDQRKEFMETYSHLINDRRNAYAKVRELEKKVKDKKNASEADYKDLSDARSKASSEIVNLNTRYDAIFSKFLSQKQIVKMKEAEEKFRTRMMEMRGKSHSKKGMKK